MTYPSEPPPQPPGHPAAAYYPAPQYAPKPLRNLTVQGVLAFAAAALATVFSLVTATISGRATRHLDSSDLDWSVAAYGIGSALEVLALLAGGIAGSLWLYQARKNAELINPAATFVRSPGWAWGGWICPVVSLWFPFQVVRDTHRAVAARSYDSTLIGWWWALYLFMNVGSWIASRAQDDATAADASGVQTADVFFSLVMLVALALWGLILRRVTVEQHARMYGAR
jgi:uncharacterized protein DUF4328